MRTKMDDLRAMDVDAIDKRIAETNARLDALGAEVEALVDAYKRVCEPQQTIAQATYNGWPKDYANGRATHPRNGNRADATVVKTVSPALTVEQQHGERQMNCQTKRRIDELLRQIAKQSACLRGLKKERRARGDGR